VDGTDKRAKERRILAALRRDRGLGGLIGDAVRVARAWR
jgi:electron transfer flavoprotein-quinone oxidoreductase